MGREGRCLTTHSTNPLSGRAMPSKPLSPCTYPGCPEYAVKNGRCDDHQPVRWKPDRERGSSSQRGYGSRWQKIRRAVLSRDHYLCQICLEVGRLTTAREVDHITSKANGGTDDMDNLQGICVPCHKRKTSEERKQ